MQMERAEGSWEMGPGDLAARVYYISFFYEQVSRQIGKLTPRPHWSQGVNPVCRNTDVILHVAVGEERSFPTAGNVAWGGLEAKEGCLQDRKVARGASAALEGPRDLGCGGLNRVNSSYLQA